MEADGIMVGIRAGAVVAGVVVGDVRPHLNSMDIDALSHSMMKIKQ
jgi:hypothetical protein